MESIEILTRPYGSGGTSGSEPHPLVMPRLRAGTSADRSESNGNDARRCLADAERPDRRHA